LVSPTIRKTPLTMTTMKRIISQVKALIPLSKLVCAAPLSLAEMDPK
jgi:hypothetical protein